MGQLQSHKAADLDVDKYFYFIKEEVSSDWKDLAFHLGFGRADTDNIASRNRDDKSCCMDLLYEWLKHNGEGATIEVLMKALSEANLQSTVDGLNKLYASQGTKKKSKKTGNPFSLKRHVHRKEKGPSMEELKTPQASNSRQGREDDEDQLAEMKGGHLKEEGSSMKDVFQKSVKTYYDLKLTYFKPLIWNDNFTLTLSDIFTQLEMVPLGHAISGQGTKLNSLDDLFNPDVTGQSTAPRCILIEGEAGGGKTTFLSKEALDAVSQKTELGKQHNIILLIRLREVNEGETIEEMVWDQCVPKTTEGIDVQSIRAILQRNEPRVLFLLDGFDELQLSARAAKQAIPELLDGKMYPNSTIVITSRPSAGVQQYTRPDCHIHITGFSFGQVEKYVGQYFHIIGNPELAEKLIPILDNSQLVTDLIHTPIFLLLVCMLWEEDQEMVSTGTMTGLYSNLLTCLVRKYCQREGVHMPTDGLPTDVAEALLQLGKLALEALLRNEALLDLAQVDLEGENLNCELLRKLGVVSLEVSASKWHPREQLNFSHKTMQEFLAGRYVAHVLKNQDIVELLQLTSISKALELRNLLLFTCGCDSGTAQAVMEELGYLCSKEFPDSDMFDRMANVLAKPCRLFKLEIEKSAAIYQSFILFCFDILNERKESDLVQAVSKALPVIILDIWGHSKQHIALKYYLENIQPSYLPERMILQSSYFNSKEGLQNLEQIVTLPIRDLRLELKLRYVQFDTPDQTARLVSVLKNVPGLRVLDLSLPKLTPSTLRPLVQVFSHLSLLEELDLSRNHDLCDAGMEVLQVGLSSVPHLAVLRLCGVFMTDVGMSSLAPYMRHLVGLRVLDVSYNDIHDTGLESLTTILPTFTAMRVLVLRGISISPTGMRTLVPALRQLLSLIELDISYNKIGDSGLEDLSLILPHLKAMEVLRLEFTRISDKGISALVKALPHLVALQVLNVNDNEIGDSGIISMVETLCQPSSLDMQQNPPSEKSLTTGIDDNTALQVLCIGSDTKVTGAGLQRVAQLISKLPALTFLDMSGHKRKPIHLPDTAAMVLAKALPRLPALEELYLYHISMEPAGFRAVVQAADEHSTLKTVLYQKGRVPEGADTRSSCLKLRESTGSFAHM